MHTPKSNRLLPDKLTDVHDQSCPPGYIKLYINVQMGHASNISQPQA